MEDRKPNPIAPMVSMVLPAFMDKIWPHAMPLLKPAIDRGGTHSVEDVRRTIMAGNAQLWVQWHEGRCEVALVTEFKHYPKGLWLNIWLTGVPKGFKFDETKVEPHIVAFAEAGNCVAIKWEGRKGWRERNKHLPVKSEDVVYTVLLRDIREAI